MRHAISLWHSRHLNVGCPIESSWQVVQLVMPLMDWCARESGPGEIWAAAGTEVHKILSTIHPRSLGFARVETFSTRAVFETAVFASMYPRTPDFRNGSDLLFEEVSESDAQGPGPSRPLRTLSIYAATMRSKRITPSPPTLRRRRLHYPAPRKVRAFAYICHRAAG